MDDPLTALCVGYVLTVAVELPILLIGLSPEHCLRRRLLAALWLNACSYPMVILFFPALFDVQSSAGYYRYLLIAETFAPASECLLFWLVFAPLRRPIRDFACITIANLASFGFGMVFHALDGDVWVESLLRGT